MSVILSDGVYRVSHRGHPAGEDDNGTPIMAPAAAPGPPRAGARNEQPDGTFSLRLDPAEWPLRVGDRVTGPDGRVYVVYGNPRLHRNVAASDVDYVGAAAALEIPDVR